MYDIFIQLSVVLGIALVFSLIMKLLKQPLIIGYILTGVVVGPAVTKMINHSELLEAFSHIGVALLLFIVGLGLQPRVIKEVGKVSLFTGLGQIIFTTGIGYLIARLIGFMPIVAFYLGLAFSLSSTIIIFQLLYKKEDQDTLYGRITIGFLLIQDLVAMFFFIILTSLSAIGSGNFIEVIITLLVKVVLVIFVLYLMMKYVTPKIDKIFADSKELLFIFSIAICFVVSTIFYKINFSIELGALLAGVMLSMSPYQREIAARLHPLRDFFLIIFFITMGANIYLEDLHNSFWMILIFSLFILIGNPLILILVMRSLKYTIRTSFYAALTVAQISEFSLIILAMGVSMGHLPKSIMAPATIIGLITITFSTYFITYNDKIYNKFRKPLKHIFNDKKTKKDIKKIKQKYSVILFGCHVMGSGLIQKLKKFRYKFIAIDHDPVIIDSLQKKGVNAVYGSADDAELLNTLPVETAKMIISTIPDLEINLFILDTIKQTKKSSHFICVANHYKDAEKLYKHGATYVVLPPYLGKKYMVDIFSKHKFTISKYNKEREKYIFDLNYLDGKD